MLIKFNQVVLKFTHGQVLRRKCADMASTIKVGVRIDTSSQRPPYDHPRLGVTGACAARSLVYVSLDRSVLHI